MKGAQNLALLLFFCILTAKRAFYALRNRSSAPKLLACGMSLAKTVMRGFLTSFHKSDLFLRSFFSLFPILSITIITKINKKRNRHAKKIFCFFLCHFFTTTVKIFSILTKELFAQRLLLFFYLKMLFSGLHIFLVCSVFKKEFGISPLTYRKIQTI